MLITLCDPIQEPVLRKAIERWGSAAQTSMAVEEMAELITAICHFGRGRIESDAVAEEIADVLIMCHQLALLAGTWRVRTHLESKMARLAERVTHA